MGDAGRRKNQRGGSVSGDRAGAYDRMIDYMMEREQFGVTLSRFDTLRFEVARIRMQLESARLLVYRAADNKDKGLPYTAEAAMAKLAASEAAVDITRKSIQFHGGYGYMADRPIEKNVQRRKDYRDLRRNFSGAADGYRCRYFRA